MCEKEAGKPDGLPAFFACIGRQYRQPKPRFSCASAPFAGLWPGRKAGPSQSAPCGGLMAAAGRFVPRGKGRGPGRRAAGKGRRSIRHKTAAFLCRHTVWRRFWLLRAAASGMIISISIRTHAACMAGKGGRGVELSFRARISHTAGGVCRAAAGRTGGRRTVRRANARAVWPQLVQSDWGVWLATDIPLYGIAAPAALRGCAAPCPRGPAGARAAAPLARRAVAGMRAGACLPCQFCHPAVCTRGAAKRADSPRWRWAAAHGRTRCSGV